MFGKNEDSKKNEPVQVNQFPIPFQNITITAETYKDVAKKINEVDSIKNNINHLIDLLSENGIEIRSDKDIFHSKITKVYIEVNNHLSDRSIKIKLD